MTGGEHSGRDYGRDDQSYPSHYGQPGEGYQDSWLADPGWPQAEETAPPDGYGSSAGYEAYAGYPGGSGGYPGGPGGYPGGSGGYPGGSGGYPDGPGKQEAAYPANPGVVGYEYGAAAYDAGGSRYGSVDAATDGWHAAASAEPPPPDQAAVTTDDPGRRRKRRGLPLWQELPLLLIIAFCLAILVRTFLLQAFYIPSGSMEDTLRAGDRVLVNKIVYQFREPARGEIVVFRAEAWSSQEIVDEDVGALTRFGRMLGDLVGISRPGEKDYIKRIIGMPGDRVSCCDVDGRVFVNGRPLDEPYVLYDAPRGQSAEGTQDCRYRDFDEVVVQPGYMFVMGDHRAVSQDSRCQGQVPIEDIIGRADLIMWPSDRWARLGATETFASVPAALPATAGAAAPAPPGLALVLPVLLSLGAVPVTRLRPAGTRTGDPPRSAGT